MNRARMPYLWVVVNAVAALILGYAIASGHPVSATSPSASEPVITWRPVQTEVPRAVLPPSAEGVYEQPATTGPSAAPAAPTTEPTPVPGARTPSPSSRAGRVTVRLTWYCEPGRSRCTSGWPASCLCVAVSPDLAWLRGRTFTLGANGRQVTVRAVDCNCQARTAIDAYASVWRALGLPLSRGVTTAEVR